MGRVHDCVFAVKGMCAAEVNPRECPDGCGSIFCYSCYLTGEHGIIFQYQNVRCSHFYGLLINSGMRVEASIGSAMGFQRVWKVQFIPINCIKSFHESQPRIFCPRLKSLPSLRPAPQTNANRPIHPWESDGCWVSVVTRGWLGMATICGYWSHAILQAVAKTDETRQQSRRYSS